MSDAAAATPQKKGKATKKKKVPSTHPKYLEMAVSAIGALQERNGSSRQAIHKYIMGKYNVGKDPKVVNTHLKMALKRGVSTGVLKHVKGQGASGSFRLSVEKKAAAEKAKTTVSKPKSKPKAPKAKPKAPKPSKKVSAKKPTKEKQPKPKAVSKPAAKKAVSKPKKKQKPAAKPKPAKKAAKKPASANKTPKKSKSKKSAKK
ncbi:histone H1-delta-like [Centruroides vittatus]|uniref:histone H1-delta-like n=1 Tax=Centruroides vittatus TaxID=120091 RepID=UPI00350FD7E9